MWYLICRLPLETNVKRQKLQNAFTASTEPTYDCPKHTPHNTVNTLLLLQSEWISRGHLAHNAYQAMLDYYNTAKPLAIKPLLQNLFFQHKGPREEWGPILWEILLQPLIKRHKAH